MKIKSGGSQTLQGHSYRQAVHRPLIRAAQGRNQCALRNLRRCTAIWDSTYETLPMDPVTASRLPPCRGRLKCRGNHFITGQLPDLRPASRSQGRNLRDSRRNSAPTPMSFIFYILTWLSFCLQVSSLKLNVYLAGQLYSRLIRFFFPPYTSLFLFPDLVFSVSVA